MKVLMAVALVLLLPTVLMVSQAAEKNVDRTVEKTVSVPERDGDVDIGVAAGGIKIESVRIQNYPDKGQVAKAKNEDPDDKSFIFWNFSVSNPSDANVKLKIDVTLIGKDGKPAGRSDRSDTIDAGNVDDNFRVMMHPRILDLVEAKSIQLKITAEPKGK